MKVFVITIQSENEGFPIDFGPEVYSNEKYAMARHQSLNSAKPKYCGYWFSIDSCQLDKKDPNWS